MKADEKRCPKCAETIKKAAVVCKHCGHHFSDAEIKTQQTADSNAGALGGCLTLVILGLGVYSCSGSSAPEKTPQQVAQETADSAEKKRQGFHCLSSWDGHHTDVESQVKAKMRDPQSFEANETRIAPVDGKGKHTLIMSYRARNGFGGMNVGYAKASIDNVTCTATVEETADN